MRLTPIIEIGPLSNFALTDYPGWASYLTAKELYDLCRQPGGDIQGVRYSEELDALVLDVADLRNYLQAMTLADVTQVAGSVKVGAIPGKPAHLCAFDATTDNVTWIESTALLSANPSIVLSIVRYPDASTNQARTNWVFNFGDGYTLEFSMDEFVTVYTPDNTAYHLDLDDTDKATFLTTLEWETYIYTDGDKLIVLPTWTSKPFIVREPNGNPWHIPAAPWSWECHAGPFALNVTEPTFSGLTGTLETPWISIECPYDDATFQSQVYPAMAAPFSSTVTVIETDTTGTKKRFGVTLASDDSHRTPFLRGVQVLYPPTMTTPTDDWLDVSCFCQDWSVSLTNRTEPNRATLSFHLRRENDGQTLDDLISSTYGSGLWGTWAVRIGLGYAYDDGTSDSRTVLTGVLEVSTSTHGIDITKEILQVTCFDRLAFMAHREFWHAPCVLDMTVADALTWWALWCGIPAEDMDVMTSARTVNDLSTGYSNPPWRPEYGTKGLELLRQLADRKGFRFYFSGEGRLQIEPRLAYDTPVCHYTSDDSSDRWLAIQSLDVAQNMGEAVGMVVVRGKKEQLTREARLDPDLAYVIMDPQATVFPGERYTGHRQTMTVVDPNLMSQPEVTAAAWESFLWRNSGEPTITLTPCYGPFDLLPGDHVLVTDAAHGFDAREFRITGIELRPNGPLIGCVLTAESVIS